MVITLLINHFFFYFFDFYSIITGLGFYFFLPFVIVSLLDLYFVVYTQKLAYIHSIHITFFRIVWSLLIFNYNEETLILKGEFNWVNFFDTYLCILIRFEVHIQKKIFPTQKLFFVVYVIMNTIF
jgi:hypothetical protein